MKSKDLFRLSEAVNEDLSRLDAWLISNKFSLIVAKGQSMLVSTKAKRKALDMSNENLQVKVQGTELEVVSSVKYLRNQMNVALQTLIYFHFLTVLKVVALFLQVIFVLRF